MRTSWADSVAAGNAASGSSTINGTGGACRLARSTFVPPYLRNRPPASEPPAPSHSGPPSGNDRIDYGA